MHPLMNFRTYFFVTGVLGSVWLVFLLGVVRSNYPRAIGGIAEWAAACLCVALAGFAFATKLLYEDHGVSSGLVRMAGNIGIMLAPAFMHESLRRFAGLTRSRCAFRLVLAAILLVVAWNGFIDSAFLLRVSLVQLALAGLSFACAILLLRMRFKKFPEHFLLSAFGLFGIAATVRLCMLLTGAETPGLQSHASAFWNAYFAVFAVLLAALTVGFMLLTGRRLGETLGHLIVHGDFDPRRNDERLELERALNQAIRANELVLHYQPRVDLRENRINALEALVRWNHPQRGLVSPAEFIPLSERTNAIIPLGMWALEQARDALERLHADVAEGLRVSVNVSARQFIDPAFIPQIRGIVERAHFLPSQLELELTESVVLEASEHAAKTMDELKHMGVRLAIDDFGTGYSSLAYLKRLPVDCVKIDASFVREIPYNREDAAITRAVIAMGHELGLKVVAEGVETEEQLQYLRDAGCDEFQGFLCSKALPIDEIYALLQHQARTGCATMMPSC